jgi:hypothetical protein
MLLYKFDYVMATVMTITHLLKTLRQLQEANLTTRRSTGADTEDPLAEIRNFLR